MSKNKLTALIYFAITGLLVAVAFYAAMRGERKLSGIYRAGNIALTQYHFRSKNIEEMLDTIPEKDRLFFKANYPFSYSVNQRSISKYSPEDRKLLRAAYFHYRARCLPFDSIITASLISDAREAEPENGWYDMLDALACFEDATGTQSSIWSHRKTAKKPEIIDKKALNRGLESYFTALKKPVFYRYEKEVNARRDGVMRPTDFNSLYFRYTLVDPFKFYSSIPYNECRGIMQVLSLHCKDLIADKKYHEVEKILDTWPLMIEFELKSESSCMYYGGEGFWNQCLKVIPPLYDAIGKPLKAARGKKQMQKIVDLYRQDRIKKMHHRKSIYSSMKSLEKHASLFFSSAAFRDFQTNPLFLKLDYIMLDQSTLLLLIPVLSAVSIILFCGTLYSFFNWSVDPQFIPSWHHTGILFMAILLPFSLWLAVTQTPFISGRDFGIRANAWSFSFQFLILFWTAINAPLLAAHLCSKNKAHTPGHVPFIPRTTFFIIITVWLLCGLLCQKINIPDRDWLIQKIDIGRMTLSRTTFTPQTYVFEWMLAGAVLLAIIISLIALGEIAMLILCREKFRDYAFHSMTMAVPVTALAAIFYFIIASTTLKQREYDLVAQINKMNNNSILYTKPPGFNAELKAIMTGNELFKNKEKSIVLEK